MGRPTLVSRAGGGGGGGRRGPPPSPLPPGKKEEIYQYTQDIPYIHPSLVSVNAGTMVYIQKGVAQTATVRSIVTLIALSQRGPQHTGENTHDAILLF